VLARFAVAVVLDPDRELTLLLCTEERDPVDLSQVGVERRPVLDGAVLP